MFKIKQVHSVFRNYKVVARLFGSSGHAEVAKHDSHDKHSHSV